MFTTSSTAVSIYWKDMDDWIRKNILLSNFTNRIRSLSFYISFLVDLYQWGYVIQTFLVLFPFWFIGYIQFIRLSTDLIFQTVSCSCFYCRFIVQWIKLYFLLHIITANKMPLVYKSLRIPNSKMSMCFGVFTSIQISTATKQKQLYLL